MGADDRPTKPVSSYVEAELSTEWQRKASFEARALGVIGASVSLATLFLLVVERLALQENVLVGLPYELASWAVAFLVGATLLGVGAAAPGRFDAPNIATVRDLAEAAAADQLLVTEADEALLHMRIDQLDRFRRTNRWKALLTFFSIGALGVGAALLTLTAVLA